MQIGEVPGHPQFRSLSSIGGIAINLRYATAHNSPAMTFMAASIAPGWMCRPPAPWSAAWRGWRHRMVALDLFDRDAVRGTFERVE